MTDDSTWHTAKLLLASLLLLVGGAVLLEEVRDEVHGHGEDDGRVLLGRDRVERLRGERERYETER